MTNSENPENLPEDSNEFQDIKLHPISNHLMEIIQYLREDDGGASCFQDVLSEEDYEFIKIVNDACLNIRFEEKLDDDLLGLTVFLIQSIHIHIDSVRQESMIDNFNFSLQFEDPQTFYHENLQFIVVAESKNSLYVGKLTVQENKYYITYSICDTFESNKLCRRKMPQYDPLQNLLTSRKQKHWYVKNLMIN